jgi:hypothetical protein
MIPAVLTHHRAERLGYYPYLWPIHLNYTDMRKKSIVPVLAVLVSGSILLSSCIGSFSMFNRILEWNRSIRDPWANEVVFLALWIIPVYEITFFLDIAILNSIEFWTGDNLLADSGTTTVEGGDGVYTVEKQAHGYTIRKDGESRTLEFVFHREDRSWEVETAGRKYKLLRFTDPHHAVVYLPGGREVKVELNQAGLLAFRQLLAEESFFATR